MNQLEIDVVLKLAQLQQEVDNLKSGLKKDGKAAGEGFAGSLGSSVIKTLAALGIAKVLKDSLGKAIGEAIGAENALTKFNQALAASGLFSEAASGSFQKLADDMQNLTGMSGEAVLQAGAMALNFSKTAVQAERLTRAAADLSAATGMTLEESVQKLGVTLSGTTGRLGMMVPGVRALTEEQLKAGAAIDFVAQRLAGFAASQGQTFAGTLARTRESLNDVFERIGMFITRSPALIAVIDVVAKTFQKLTEILDTKLRGNQDVLRGFIETSLDFAGVLIYNLGGALEFGINLIVAFTRGLTTLVAAIVEMASGNVRGALTALKDQFIEIGTDMLNIPITEAMTNTVMKAREAVENASPQLREIGKVMGDSIRQPMEESLNAFSLQMVVDKFRLSVTEMNEMARSLAASMKGTITNGFTNAFSAIGGALVKGENAFAAFGKAILGMFGDLAIQLGQYYMLLGIASLWTNPAAGAGMIAGGAALMVLGGALKALAGGGGGGGAGASSGSQSASGGGSTTAPLGGAAGQPQEQAGPQTGITVNVSGNILDRRQTGLELAEAINEAFNTDGVVVARGAIT